MSSFARWMLQYSLKNSREYPKTSGAIPRGLRPLGIAPSVFGYSLSFFREYFAIRLAKLHILLHSLTLNALMNMQLYLYETTLTIIPR